MIELKWHRLTEADPPGGMAMTFSDGASYTLQYRESLPRHPGFVMQADPTTGLPVQTSDKWTDWKTVDTDEAPPPIDDKEAA